MVKLKCREAQYPLERRAQEGARTFLEEVYPGQKRLEEKEGGLCPKVRAQQQQWQAGRIGGYPPNTRRGGLLNFLFFILLVFHFIYVFVHVEKVAQ